MCSATRCPSTGVFSESSSPESTNTGRFAGAIGVPETIGGSSDAGAGHFRQASNSSIGEVTHSWTVNGAKLSASRAATAAAYWARRVAGGARRSNACG